MTTIVGPWRRPVNIGAGASGSIHDDAEARRHGFRGGTIAGSVHMDQFWGFLAGLHGPRWLTHGGLSLVFLHATVGGEAVRCVAENAATWMETEDGTRVAEGTLDLDGGSPATAVRLRLAAARAPRALRMLADAVPESRVTATGRWPAASVAEYLHVMTEPLPLYSETPPGLPPDKAINVLRAVETALIPVNGPATGLYGTIELRMLGEPLRADTDYDVSGTLLALTDSPKTESAWYHATARRGGDAAVAEMWMQARLLKSSSALWTVERP